MSTVHVWPIPKAALTTMHNFYQLWLNSLAYRTRSKLPDMLQSLLLVSSMLQSDSSPLLLLSADCWRAHGCIRLTLIRLVPIIVQSVAWFSSVRMRLLVWHSKLGNWQCASSLLRLTSRSSRIYSVISLQNYWRTPVNFRLRTTAPTTMWSDNLTDQS